MTAAHTLRTEGLVSGYGRTTIVDGVDLQIPTGKVSVIVGANACGKSTLLKTIARLLPTQSGAVLLDGQAIARLPTNDLARTLGLLPQQPVAPEGIAVADLVGRGRHPHQKMFRSWSADDDRAVTEALAATGVLDLADRAVDELSGGQRQRVWIALALAQQTDVLLLDEPTTYLDIARQVEILDILGQLQRTRGITLVMVLHELSLAARYADVLVAVKDGGVAARGPAHEVMTDETVSSMFDMRARVLHDEVTGARVVIPLSTGRADAPAEGARS